MTPKKLILKFIQQAYENKRQSDPAEKEVERQEHEGPPTVSLETHHQSVFDLRLVVRQDERS